MWLKFLKSAKMSENCLSDYTQYWPIRNNLQGTSTENAYIFYFFDNFLENLKEQVSDILKIRNMSI